MAGERIPKILDQISAADPGSGAVNNGGTNPKRCQQSGQLHLRQGQTIWPRTILGLRQCADDRFTGHAIRLLPFKHGLDGGEELTTEAVVLRLLRRQLDRRPSCAIRPIAPASSAIANR